MQWYTDKAFYTNYPQEHGSVFSSFLFCLNRIIRIHVYWLCIFTAKNTRSSCRCLSLHRAPRELSSLPTGSSCPAPGGHLLCLLSRGNWAEAETSLYVPFICPRRRSYAVD